MCLLVCRYVELRSQHFHVAGESFHDERMGGIMLHVEHGFAGEFHTAISIEPYRIFQFCPAVQANAGSVLKCNVYTLSCRCGNGQILFCGIFDNDGSGSVPTACDQ